MQVLQRERERESANNRQRMMRERRGLRVYIEEGGKVGFWSK